MNEAAPVPVPRLEDVLAEGWRSWAEASRTPGHPFRTPVVATAGDEGDARVVVLRAVDRDAAELEFHTDARSPKVEALRRSPRLTWVFHDPVGGIQWRVRGHARLHAGDELWRSAWERVPTASRASYTSPAAPGTVVRAPMEAIDFPGGGPQHFMVVRCRAERVDWLRLRPEGNLRAQWTREGETWCGAWIAP